MLQSAQPLSPPAITPDNERIDWIASLPFVGLHAACLAAWWIPPTRGALLLACGLYVVRMFGITAAYHRYFSHRSYRTSRGFQFVLAVLGCTALQKGPLWWAAHHRHHHKHSDREPDVHSPELRGFWWSHVGWILCARYDATEVAAIKDFARYPELVWLNRFCAVPGILLAIGCFVALGWSGLIWGFFVSTVVLYHATFFINSLCHMLGRVRYRTDDASRNSLILAVVTLGEGWHNNHHHYPTSSNMGFFWWEIDLTYYGLKVLSWVGLVWDLRRPPPHVLTGGRTQLSNN